MQENKNPEDVPADAKQILEDWVEIATEAVVAEMDKAIADAKHQLEIAVVKAPAKAMELIGKIRSGIDEATQLVDTGKAMVDKVKSATGKSKKGEESAQLLTGGLIKKS